MEVETFEHHELNDGLSGLMADMHEDGDLLLEDWDDLVDLDDLIDTTNLIDPEWDSY